MLVQAGEMIDEAIAKNITDAGIKEVEIRSIFGCKAKNGICRKCYGRNLATGEQVELGEAIGIMAAQSIGEPGTQLTMRTFTWVELPVVLISLKVYLVFKSYLKRETQKQNLLFLKLMVKFLISLIIMVEQKLSFLIC